MNIFYLSILTLGTIFINSCSSAPASSYTISNVNHLKMKGSPSIGKTSSNQDLFLGGFSGLMLKEAANKNELILETITDRGPIGFLINVSEPQFLLPEFSPQIPTLKINLENNYFEVLTILKLQKKMGEPLTGLPNNRLKESPVDNTGLMYSTDPEGINSQSIVSDGEGGYWVGENYSPSLVHFNGQGKIIRRLTPFNELPKIYGETKLNRGFQGVAKDKNKIFGFLQGALATDKNFARIVEIDLETFKTSAEYFYPFEENMDEINDATSLGNNKFLVIEQNGLKGVEGQKCIYKITLNGIDNLVIKELLVDLGTTSFKFMQKIEGIAVIDSHRIAIVNNNGFQINGLSDIKSALIPLNDNSNEILILEFREDFTK
jgi:3-phytase